MDQDRSLHVGPSLYSVTTPVARFSTSASETSDVKAWHDSLTIRDPASVVVVTVVAVVAVVVLMSRDSPGPVSDPTDLPGDDPMPSVDGTMAPCTVCYAVR